MFGTSSSISSRTLRSDRARSISCSSNVLLRSSPRLGGFVKWRRRNSCIAKFRESEPPRRRRWMLHRSTVEYGTRRKTAKVRGPRQVRAVQPEAAPSPPPRLHHRIASDNRAIIGSYPAVDLLQRVTGTARQMECQFCRMMADGGGQPAGTLMGVHSREPRPHGVDVLMRPRPFGRGWVAKTVSAGPHAHAVLCRREHSSRALVASGGEALSSPPGPLAW